MGNDGTVSDAIAGSSAYEACISPERKVVGVNGRVYTCNLLEDVIKAAKGPDAPITLLVVNDDDYRTVTVNCHGGQRYPHLVRDESKPDYLSELIKARSLLSSCPPRRGDGKTALRITHQNKHQLCYYRCIMGG